MDLGIGAAGLALIGAGGWLVYDSVARPSVSEIEHQQRHPLAACLTRAMALWLGLAFLALGAVLLVLEVITAFS